MIFWKFEEIFQISFFGDKKKSLRTSEIGDFLKFWGNFQILLFGDKKKTSSNSRDRWFSEILRKFFRFWILEPNWGNFEIIFGFPGVRKFSGSEKKNYRAFYTNELEKPSVYCGSTILRHSDCWVGSAGGKSSGGISGIPLNFTVNTEGFSSSFV